MSKRQTLALAMLVCLIAWAPILMGAYREAVHEGGCATIYSGSTPQEITINTQDVYEPWPLSVVFHEDDAGICDGDTTGGVTMGKARTIKCDWSSKIKAGNGERAEMCPFITRSGEHHEMKAGEDDADFDTPAKDEHVGGHFTTSTEVGDRIHLRLKNTSSTGNVFTHFTNLVVEVSGS